MTDTDFRPLAFFVADHAAVENGKLYVNGGFWNRLAFPSFPAMLSFSIVAVVEVPWRAYHQPHKFTVRFEDADGHPISGFLEGEFQVGAAAELKRGDPTPLPFAAQVNNFAFQ